MMDHAAGFVANRWQHTHHGRARAVLMSMLLVSLLACATPVWAQTDEPTVASLFDDFLHFSVLGKFDLADTYAVQLLDRSDLDPVDVLKLSEKNRSSIDTLILLVNNSSISDNASKILDVIREGEHLQRQNTERILANIKKLGGPPQMEFNATQRLADSGEYAIPWLIQTLRDGSRQSLWPRVIRALPKIGKPAVQPLVQALNIDDESIRRTIVSSLAELGYPQAVPFLQAVTLDDDTSPETKNAAIAAVARIESRHGRPIDTSAPDGFVRLAEQFYDEHGSVAADVRLREANVWYWDGDTQFLSAVAVPQRIFGSVMAMRACEKALSHDSSHGEAFALWLAANIRRESRLGMDIESGDASESGDEADPTRPPNYPRALYFTTAAGARYAHMVLHRAVTGSDAAVALGAIAALRGVAGPSSLIGSEDHKQAFVEALKFPDLLVRIRAALALGNAVPRQQFTGSELVIPILANAITQTGRRNILVLDADQNNTNRLLDELRDADTNVIGEANALSGLARARGELESLSAILLSTNITSPGPAEAIAAIRSQYDIAKTPIILMVTPDQAGLADQLVAADAGVEAVDAHADSDLLLDRLEKLQERLGRTPLDTDAALALALQAARTVGSIALDGDSVFDAAMAERALIATLDSVHEELQIACIEALAILPSSAAQQAIASAALPASHTESLRIAAFGAVSASAKRFGHQLDGARMADLLEAASDEPNLRLRTAASQALGALNLEAAAPSQIIKKYERG